ncbi:MAG: SprT family zinc-dependent metalloprotease [Pseudomonadales bacterium]|nr:SprT family zinc-dependent metalloprotease [Pseudomonadales bacterium]
MSTEEYAPHKLIVPYGDSQIVCHVSYELLNSRKVIIRVHPDSTISVNASPGAHLVELKAAVSKRARWICKQLEKLETNTIHVLPREYVSGETHYYLGRRYLLKIFVVSRQEESVKLLRGQLQVRTYDRDANHVKKLLAIWYREHARQQLDNRLKQLAASMPWLDEAPCWQLKRMKKQWGSCSSKGTLILNPSLVKAPRDCVNYVLVHELCHLKEHNHGRGFYALLNKALPGWQESKARLDSLAEVILNN